MFRDLNGLALLIRQTNEAARGWAPTPRALTDTQPAIPLPSGQTAPLYSSLLNPLLIPALVQARGLAPAQQKPAKPPPRKQPTGAPRGRPKGSKNKPKATP